MVSDSKKEEIKSALDVVTVIQRTINLTKKSNSEYVGATSRLSKSGASLHVDRGLQLWHDLSGRAKPEGGDVFDWIAYENNLDTEKDFPEVLKIAADLAGVEVEEITEEQKQKIAKKKSIHEMLTKAAEVYHSNLTPEIRAYISSKWGISNEMINRLKIGYAKPDNGNCNLGKIADCEEWVETGLFTVINKDISNTGEYTQTAYEIFKGRVVFPYWHGGKVVNFAARGDFVAPINTPKAKWEMSGDQIIKYRKLLTHSEKHPYVNEAVNNSYIWGADTLKGHDYCIITEGVADAIVLMQNEYPVLSPVTTKFAKHDIENLMKLTKKLEAVYLCNDNEDSGAGEEGAIRTGLTLKKEGADVRIIMLPKGNLDKIDVAEYFLKHTKEEFEIVKDECKDIFTHILRKQPLSPSADELTSKNANYKTAANFVKKVLTFSKDIEEVDRFIRNTLKDYFPHFTNKDCAELLKQFKIEVKHQEEQKGGMQFDIDSTSGRSIMTHVLAEKINKIENIKYISGALRMYKNGVYEADTEDVLKLQKKIINIALNEHKTPIQVSHARQIVEMLETMNSVPRELINTNPNVIAVNNGILNLETLEFTEFSPEKIFLNKIPVNYDPSAAVPEKLLQTLELCFRSDDKSKKTIQEVMGYCLVSSYKYQNIFYLIGDGGNGKGTVLKFFKFLVGEKNCAANSLYQLTDHPNVDYFVASLHEKKINICGDIGTKKIQNTEHIKKLSSGTDLITARLPKEKPFEFMNTAKIIVLGNKVPETDAYTTGDKRRNLIITFENKISDTDQDIKGFADNMSGEEMSGVLNWAIEGLQRLEKNGNFTIYKTVAQKGLEYNMKSNPMYYFVEECVEEDQGGYVPNALVYEAYNNFRKHYGLPELSEAVLKNDLKKYCAELSIFISETRKDLKEVLGLKVSKDDEEKLGKRPRVLKNIKLIPFNKQTTFDKIENENTFAKSFETELKNKTTLKNDFSQLEENSKPVVSA